MVKGVRCCSARRARRNRGLNPRMCIIFYLYIDLLTLLSYLFISHLPKFPTYLLVPAHSLTHSLP